MIIDVIIRTTLTAAFIIACLYAGRMVIIGYVKPVDVTRSKEEMPKECVEILSGTGGYVIINGEKIQIENWQMTQKQESVGDQQPPDHPMCDCTTLTQGELSTCYGINEYTAKHNDSFYGVVAEAERIANGKDA